MSAKTKKGKDMTKRTMIRLPPDLHEELKVLAETHDRSQAQEIVTGLKFYARLIKKREARYAADKAGASGPVRVDA